MTVSRCIQEGLVGGESFVVDASLIKADADRQRGVPGAEGLPPDIINHAVREYLEVLDKAASRAALPVTPKYLSPADPAARSTGAHGGQAFFAYSTNYLIDLTNAVIVDVEASTAIRQAEVTAQRTMIDRTQKRFGIWPQRLAADTGYGDAANLAWRVHKRGIEPHISVFDHVGRSPDSFQRTVSAMTTRTISMPVSAASISSSTGGTMPTHGPARAKKGRNAVRPSQTHPEARPLASTRTKWRKRRFPPRSYSPEPAQARDTYPDPVGYSPSLTPGADLTSTSETDNHGRLQNHLPPTEIPPSAAYLI
jgi:hypothetical protein